MSQAGYGPGQAAAYVSRFVRSQDLATRCVLLCSDTRRVTKFPAVHDTRRCSKNRLVLESSSVSIVAEAETQTQEKEEAICGSAAKLYFHHDGPSHAADPSARQLFGRRWPGPGVTAWRVDAWPRAVVWNFHTRRWPNSHDPVRHSRARRHCRPHLVRRSTRLWLSGKPINCVVCRAGVSNTRPATLFGNFQIINIYVI